MSIFKAYDVRGIYPDEIDEHLAYKIGRAFVVFMKAKQVVVSQDMRVSSDSLKKELLAGITDQGADVIEVQGFSSTPKHYFASWWLKAPASIMVTASHNPGKYNGFKFTRKDAIAISGEDGIKDMEKLVAENSFRKPTRKGRIIRKDITEEYKKHLMKFVDAKKIRPLKVVIDAGNGMGGRELELILDKLPLHVIKMYFEPDGSFPNHEANPLLDENCKAIIKRIRKEKADLGIAPDGDVDRVFFFDEKGRRIPGDLVTALIAEKLLERGRGEKVLYDLRSSWATKEKIEEHGGKALMCRVGHAFIKERMRKTNALFAGELSGHFYFRENFFTDSGIIAALKFLQIVSRKNKKVSDIIEPMKKYYVSGEINSTVKNKDKIMKKLGQLYADGKVTWIDGIRVDYDDWWFNVRPSNTEPLLRLNLEAKTKELMEEKRDEILGIIRS